MSWLDRLRGRREAGGGGTTADAAPAAETVAAEILDAHGWRTIQFQVSSPRVSDALNDADQDLEPRLDDGTPVDLDQVFLVIPPERPSGDPSRRLHRPVHQLWVRVGDCAIVGSLHIPPGAAGSAYLLRRNHQFFVLTKAKVTRPVPNGREERVLPVLLVNLHQVRSLRDTPEPDFPAALEVPPA